MKKIINSIYKKISGKNYIHLPKNKVAKCIVKSIFDIERFRGRGRNLKAIKEDLPYNIYLLKQLSKDGHVPMKYASYLYAKLK